MRPSKPAWCLLALLLPLAVPAVGQEASPVPEVERAGFDPGESSALFAGISRFEELAEVPFAVDDAVDLAYLFTLELGLVEPSRVVLALGGERSVYPKNRESRERLEALAEAGVDVQDISGKGVGKFNSLLVRQAGKAGKRGMFLFGLATHGFNHGEIQYLAVADTPSVSSSTRAAIVSSLKLTEVLGTINRESRSQRKLVLLDACQERLTAERGVEEDERTAMSDEAFRSALAEAQGQVVLQGAPTGGYSYDDETLQNGVFTAAVIDGLSGAAEADERSLITSRALADYVQQRVAAWVAQNRSEDAAVSTGIGMQLDGSAADMPLALAAGRRRDALIAHAWEVVHQTRSGRPVLSSEDGVKIERLLAADEPPDDLPVLLQLVENLDRRNRGSQTALKVYLDRRSTGRRVATGPAPRPADSPAESPAGSAETQAPESEIDRWTEDPWLREALAGMTREEREELRRPYIGLEGRPGRPAWVMVGSPAERAGLRSGDTLLEIELHSADGEIKKAGAAQIGDVVWVSAERGGERLEARVRMEAPPGLEKRAGLLGTFRLASYLDALVREVDMGSETAGTCEEGVDIGLWAIYCRLGEGFLASLDRLSGHEVFVSGPHGGDPVIEHGGKSFGHYNPEFVRWATQQVPDGDNQHPAVAAVLGRVYEAWVREVARTYYVAYGYIRAHAKASNELVAWYGFAADKPGFLERWIENRTARLMQEGATREQALDRVGAVGFRSPFKVRLDEQARPFADSLLEGEHDWYVAYRAYGFWIRRLVDGTADEFYTGLVKLLQAYDSEWLSVHR